MHKIRAVLFDLDGTLLQVEMAQFVPAYIGGLARHFADLAAPEAFAATVRGAIGALLANDDGGRSNEALFLAALERCLGIPPALFAERLARFCADGLADLAPLIRPLPLARPILERARDRGLAVVLATNPVFPRALIEARLAWGKLADLPFAHLTCYENSRFCKPNPRYFTDLLERLGLAPKEALMVGNDTGHDLAARQAGIATFLVDTWLVDRANGAFTTDFRGGHEELLRLLGQVG